MRLDLAVTVAVRDVDVALTVEARETVAITGPNGAGKSTVLACVAGLVRPDGGHVRLGDRTLSEGRRFVAAHDRSIALLAQEPLLFPHLTVAENVAFGPRSARRGRTASRAVAGRWMEEVGVSHLASRRPGTLSGGQAQRVAVARALATEPDVLLLDEPLAALDVDAAPEVRGLLARVLAQATVLLVTHDADDVAALADRVVRLEAGRLVST